MKIASITILTLLVTASVFGQVEYDITLRFGNSLTSSEAYSRSFSYDQRQQINSNQYTEQNVTSTSNYETIFSELGRFEIEGSIVFPVAHGFHIKTGLGLAYQKIGLDQKYVNGNSMINSTDTLDGIIPTIITNSNYKPCQFENSSNEIAVPNDVSTLWSLIVPLEIEYDVVDRFAISVGGYLETPIISKHTSHYITSMELEELEDYRLCEWILKTDEDSNGSRFNDLVLGLSLAASYQITHHLSAEIKYRQNNKGTYSDTYNTGFSFSRYSGEFKNRNVMLGISYKFGSHDAHNIVIEE